MTDLAIYAAATTPVPEPATLTLVGAGMLAWAARPSKPRRSGEHRPPAASPAPSIGIGLCTKAATPPIDPSTPGEQIHGSVSRCLFSVGGEKPVAPVPWPSRFCRVHRLDQKQRERDDDEVDDRVDKPGRIPRDASRGFDRRDRCVWTGSERPASAPGRDWRNQRRQPVGRAAAARHRRSWR